MKDETTPQSATLSLEDMLMLRDFSLSEKDFIAKIAVPGVQGSASREQVIAYLATFRDLSDKAGVTNKLLRKISGVTNVLRAAISMAMERPATSGIGVKPEILAGVGVGVLSVAEILSSQYKVIFQGTEREFHCPLDISDVHAALEVKFAQEIHSGKLVLETGKGGRLFFKNKTGDHLLTVILQSGKRDSAAYPDHPITTTVLKMSQANLELLEAKVLGGVNQVLDQAINYAGDNRISFFEGADLAARAIGAAASVVKTGGIGVEVLSVIAQELDKAEEAYKVTRDNQIDKSVDDAEADKAQRQCMYCGVERLKGDVSCTRCGSPYEPAKKH